MKLYNTSGGIVVEAEGKYYRIEADWVEFINDDRLFEKLKMIVQESEAGAGARDQAKDLLSVAVGPQEVWASGVTYYNSKMARQEESARAGGGTFYERVYSADRPELFFKATAARTVASGGRVHIRKDSTWDVPEPELTLVITASGKIVGYTIGNDMSSRSIEGENPLYLPQAKTFDACAGLGPCILVTNAPLSPDTRIAMDVLRGEEKVFSGHTTLDQMKRRPAELVEYLFRECSFPFGCLLMTGTGIVPGPDFTLAAGDEIRIAIEPIGTLINFVK